MVLTNKRQIKSTTVEQNSETVLKDHVVKHITTRNALVQEYDVIAHKSIVPFWKRDLNIPRWLVSLLISLTIIIFTAFAAFTSVVRLKKESNGGACQSNVDCRQDLGLLCNNYRCGCAYSHFWSATYQICERQRMINRTCTSDMMCDSLGNLQCFSVVSSSGITQLQCQCQPGMHWNGEACTVQQSYNETCQRDINCDSTRFLFCDMTAGMFPHGRCRCNASMFWNGMNSQSGTCEYKRTLNQYCYPYKNDWCDDAGPNGQGLICAMYSNPYGSFYGICQCDLNSFYNGTRCIPHRLYNESCEWASECDYRINLTCSKNRCLCGTKFTYNPNINNFGVIGFCEPTGTYLDNCTSNIGCSSSQNLYCNGSGLCTCNASWSYWDGLTCASKLSIGGHCSSDIQCMASKLLFCSSYPQSLNTCDCDKYHYWNETCMKKLFFGTNCSVDYQCDDNRGLHCLGQSGSLSTFQTCACYNSSYTWDSLYIMRNQTCIEKLTYNGLTCYGDEECDTSHFLICANGTCKCISTDYWDGISCQPKRTYLVPCSMTEECQDYSPVNLICRIGPAMSLQCVCEPNQYWENCTGRCITAKQIYEPCLLTGNCTSNECDQTANLQCINDTLLTSASYMGRCNCTKLQWWNGTYCRNKGIPSWASQPSAFCNSTYQCADYNLVSCPLGGLLGSNATCECGTTYYWNGFTCVPRVEVNQACTSWNDPIVNTTTCLSAAGAGLECSKSSCNGTVCIGFCFCPTGRWNSSFLICA